MSGKHRDPEGRAEALFLLGHRYRMSGEIDLAIKAYAESIQIAPSAEAHAFLGLAYSLRGDYERAIAECRRGIALDPEYGGSYNDIGCYLLERGKAEEAVAWLEQALRAPRYDARHLPRFHLGRAFASMGLLRRAASEFRAALSLQPGYEPAREALERAEIALN